MSARIPGQKLVVIDEVWRYVNPNKIPIELMNLVQSGRRRGVHLLLNCQEPNKLNSTILNGASEFVSFKLQGEKALDVVQGFGFDREEVSGLQPLQFVARNLDSGGELRGRIEI